MKKIKNQKGQALLVGVIVIIVVLLLLGITARLVRGSGFNIPQASKIKQAFVKAKNKNDVQTSSKTTNNTQSTKANDEESTSNLNLEVGKEIEYTKDDGIEIIGQSEKELITYVEDADVKSKETGKALIKYNKKRYLVSYQTVVGTDDSETSKLTAAEELTVEPDLYVAHKNGKKVYEYTSDDQNIQYISVEYNDKVYTKMITKQKNSLFTKETELVFEDYPDIYYSSQH